MTNEAETALRDVNAKLIARVAALEAEIRELRGESIHNQSAWLSPLDPRARA